MPAQTPSWAGWSGGRWWLFEEERWTQRQSWRETKKTHLCIVGLPEVWAGIPGNSILLFWNISISSNVVHKVKLRKCCFYNTTSNLHNTYQSRMLPCRISFNFFNVYFWERGRERDRACGQRERETQNMKQAPGSELSAQSPMRVSNPWTNHEIMTLSATPPLALYVSVSFSLQNKHLKNFFKNNNKHLFLKKHLF